MFVELSLLQIIRALLNSESPGSCQRTWNAPDLYFSREAQTHVSKNKTQQQPENPLKCEFPSCDDWGYNQLYKSSWGLLGSDLLLVFAFLPVSLFATLQIKVILSCLGCLPTWGLRLKYHKFTTSSHLIMKEGKRTGSTWCSLVTKTASEPSFNTHTWITPRVPISLNVMVYQQVPGNA